MDKTVKIEDGRSGHDTLLGGALALTLSVIIVKIIGFFYKLPLSHILGDEGMGYFNSAYSIFTFFYMLCTGGVPRAVSITVTEALAKGKPKRAEKILSVSLKLYLTVGIALSAVLMLFSSHFSRLIGNSLSAFSLFCIAPSLSFVAASGVLRGYMNGKMKMKEIAFAEVLEGAVKFVAGLALAMLGVKRELPLHMIAALTVLGVTVGTFIGSFFLFVCFKNEKSKDKFEQNNTDTDSEISLLKSVLKISIPITVTAAIMGISNIADLGLIIKRLVAFGLTSSEAVALFGNFTTLAVPMLNLVAALTSPLAASAVPHLTNRFASGDKRGFEEISRTVLTLSALVAFPVAAMYFFFSEEILLLLFPAPSAVIGAPLLRVLSVSVISFCSLTVLNCILESTLHPRISVISMSIGAVLKIVSGYILIGRFGIIGAPISTGICYSVSFLISVGAALFYAKINVPVVELSAVPFIASLIAVGGARFLYNSISDGTFSPIRFILLAALAASFYALIVGVLMHKKIRSVLAYVKIAKN